MSEATTPDAFPASADLTTLWRRYRDLRRAYRTGSLTLHTARHRLGSEISRKHDELVHAGHKSDFQAWLRSQHLPVASAYRLMAFARSQPARPPKPAPVARLTGQDFSVPLNPRQLALVRTALDHLLDPNIRHPEPFRPTAAIAAQFVANTPSFVHQQLHALKQRRDITAEFVAALPPITVPV